MSVVTEVAPDLYRISTYLPDFNLQFNQFLAKDDEPLLFHTGLKSIFPAVREAVSSLINPAEIKWVSFSHFEADECGTLNDWLTIAPNAKPACSLVGAMVSIDDIALRPARGLADGEVLQTGKYRFRFLQTPHVPHCWEAGLLYEETQKTLLCSDLFTHQGNVEPQTTSDIVGRAKQDLVSGQQGPLANAYPYTAQTEKILFRLAALKPKTLATMHGSTFVGDGERALKDLAVTLKEVLGKQI